jgi:hypothetical protein
MATFISLTHLVNNKRVPVYVNVDQIYRIGDSVGGGPGYATKRIFYCRRASLTCAKLSRMSCC